MSTADVLAHGVGGRQDLPLTPAQLAIGAGLAIVASFVVLGVAWREPRLDPAPTETLRPTHHQRLWPAHHQWPTWLLRTVGAALAVLLVWQFTRPDNENNPAAGMVYVLFWVGLVPLSLLLGPIWRHLNPLRTLVTVVRRGPARPLPEGLGYWPAAAGLLAFAWLELVAPDRATLPVLGAWLAAYAAAMLTAGLIYGPAFYDRGDAFEALSDLIGRLTPLTRTGSGNEPPTRRKPDDGNGRPARRDPHDGGGRPARRDRLDADRRPARRKPDGDGRPAERDPHDGGGRLAQRERLDTDERPIPDRPGDGGGRLVWRNPLDGIAGLRGAPGIVAVVVVLLGSTFFDALSGAPFWLRFSQENGLPAVLTGTLGLLVVIGVVAGAYQVATRAAGRRGRAAGDAMPGEFAHTIVPVAAGYIVAHYWSLFILEGQRTVALLAGADDFRPYAGIVTPTGVANLQVTVIVLGHLVGTVLAHDRALRLFPRGRATTGQLPLLGLMVAYTVLGLFLLFAG